MLPSHCSSPEVDHPQAGSLQPTPPPPTDHHTTDPSPHPASQPTASRKHSHLVSYQECGTTKCCEKENGLGSRVQGTHWAWGSCTFPLLPVRQDRARLWCDGSTHSREPGSPSSRFWDGTRPKCSAQQSRPPGSCGHRATCPICGAHAAQNLHSIEEVAKSRAAENKAEGARVAVQVDLFETEAQPLTPRTGRASGVSREERTREPSACKNPPVQCVLKNAHMLKITT